jgi:hypothetical protein
MVRAIKKIMRNKIPYALISILLFCKLFFWWLLIWGTDFLKVENTLVGMFEPIHQFSYATLSSFLVIGILFRSRFAFIAMFGASLINFLIYVLRGTAVYQSLLDPIILVLFSLALYFSRPNTWFKSDENI